MDWKKEALRWKRAFWASMDDTAEERAEILRKQRAKRKKATKKPKKATKARKPTKRKTKQLSLF